MTDTTKVTREGEIYTIEHADGTVVPNLSKEAVLDELSIEEEDLEAAFKVGDNGENYAYIDLDEETEEE